jgi:hypothetical protein
MKRLFGVVLCSVLLLCGSFASSAHAASALFLQVPTTTVQAGDQITASVLVRSPDQSINAVSGTVLFPDTKVRVVSVSKSGSVVDLWTRDPSVQRGKIPFEGIILNPGFQGARGAIFQITFEAKTSGPVTISFSDGAVLANDGLGSNIASSFLPASFSITSGSGYTPIGPYQPSSSTGSISALPVITDFSASVSPEGAAYVKGKGEPNAMTKIVFQNTSFRSIGEQFIAFLQTKKQTLDEVIIKNDENGEFEYRSSSGILAGAYNATPYLVDSKEGVEKPGLGVQLFVSDSPLVRVLVIVINVLALLIPVVGLIVVIYFIPWYSFRRMRVLGRRFGLEEDKLTFTRRAFRHDNPLPPTPPITPR